MSGTSKEEQVLELFLNEPTKQWHFTKIVETANVGERSASHWLRKFKKEKLVRHMKPKGRMPYFQANYSHPNYDSRKRLFAMNRLYETGLLAKLQGLRNTKALVIFGSFFRGDWNIKSDVDVFIYGDPENLRYGLRWPGLGFQGKSREVQVHSFSSLKELRGIHSGLIKNVVKGYFVKGNIHDIAQVKA